MNSPLIIIKLSFKKFMVSMEILSTNKNYFGLFLKIFNLNFFVCFYSRNLIFFMEAVIQIL